jgi:DNA-binding NarL/FixJ family response regulator
VLQPNKLLHPHLGIKRKAFLMKKIRILIIEDNRILLNGIAAMINGQKDMQVVATIGSGNNVLLKARQTRPDMILMDAGLKNLKESSVVESIKEQMPEVTVIGMGFVPTQLEIVEFVESGASGFILKDASVKEILATIRSAAKGEKILPPSLAGSLFSFVADHAVKKRKGEVVKAVRMTKREREIVVLVADGLSNKEIAEKLNLATYTVKSHMHNIMEKLALHSRLQIARHARDEEPF